MKFFFPNSVVYRSEKKKRMRERRGKKSEEKGRIVKSAVDCQKKRKVRTRINWLALRGRGLRFRRGKSVRGFEKECASDGNGTQPFLLRSSNEKTRPRHTYPITLIA